MLIGPQISKFKQLQIGLDLIDFQKTGIKKLTKPEEATDKYP